ncbi:hypothetical protein BDR07DRAFT_1483048 [Suillus spraguei]|nr:hypothetical protein BDR07DRAFT_1483048 [Suillus spraguei]
MRPSLPMKKCCALLGIILPIEQPMSRPPQPTHELELSPTMVNSTTLSSDDATRAGALDAFYENMSKDLED